MPNSLERENSSCEQRAQSPSEESGRAYDVRGASCKPDGEPELHWNRVRVGSYLDVYCLTYHISLPCLNA